MLHPPENDYEMLNDDATGFVVLVVALAMTLVVVLCALAFVTPHHEGVGAWVN